MIPNRLRTAREAKGSRLRNERGAVLVLMALALVVFLGIAALAIDLGLLFVARSEAQRTADAAAHAGAGYFLVAPNDEAGARNAAVAVAGANTVRGDSVTLDPDDIDVDMTGNRRLVRVRVLRTQDSGNPVQTLFARALGIQEVGVAASAAAEVFSVAGDQCILPIAIPDRFCVELDGTNCTRWSDRTSGPGSVARYEPWIANPEDPPAEWVENNNPTGFSAAQRGETITLIPGVGPPSNTPGGGGPPGGRPGGGGGTGGGDGFAIPSWWSYTTRSDQSVGNQDVLRLLSCERTVSLGTEMQAAPGARQRLVGDFNAIYQLDPTAVWNEAANQNRGCVTDPGSNVCRSSPRIRPIVLFDPTVGDPTGPAGSSSFQISGFLGIFVQQPSSSNPGGQGGEVTARIVEFSSTGPSTPGLVPGTFGRMIRIVE